LLYHLQLIVSITPSSALFVLKLSHVIRKSRVFYRFYQLKKLHIDERCNYKMTIDLSHFNQFLIKRPKILKCMLIYMEYKIHGLILNCRDKAEISWFMVLKIRKDMQNCSFWNVVFQKCTKCLVVASRVYGKLLSLLKIFTATNAWNLLVPKFQNSWYLTEKVNKNQTIDLRSVLIEICKVRRF